MRMHVSIDEARRRVLDDLVARAHRAAEQFREYTQEDVDRIARAMVRAGLRAAYDLARMAVEETGIGVLEDKYLKNMVASEFTWHSIRDKRSVGILREDPETRTLDVAEPIGVILSLTAITNPTSTVMFKSILAAKTANTLVISAHSRAWKCSTAAARIMRDAGVAAGAPKDFLTFIEEPRREDTLYLLTHPLVKLIDATGGCGMVRVAYSTGKLALGVGPGNTATYIHRSADVDMAVVDILTSKTFDNGVICASEGTVLIDAEIYDAVLDAFRRLGAYVCSREEAQALERVIIDGTTCSMRHEAAGRSAEEIARFCGIAAPPGTRLLIVELDGVGREVPMSAEKLCPILTVHRVHSEEEAIRKARMINDFGGTGHTASIFAEDEDLIRRYGCALNAGRVIVNSPSSIGALGGVYNDLVPTFSFGCGTGGGNSVMGNITLEHYLNVKKVARRTPAHQQFRIPSVVFFQRQSIENLREIEVGTVLLLTTSGAVERGAAGEVLRHLPAGARAHVYADLPPEPTIEQVRVAAEFAASRHPDALIALGGGSVIDAAKIVRLLVLAPDADLEDLSTPFLDFRKRIAEFPRIDPARLKLIAIPTTAGTGSEVSPFAVVQADGRKRTFVDTCLVPDAAILEPELTRTMPPRLTASTGMDALTHAIEAGLSIFASDFTDAMALQAARLIFEYLPRAVRDGSDMEARAQMLNAACMAGIAFSNASVGVTHALSHALGALFPVAHGTANGIFLPAVIRYNAVEVPAKITPNPNVRAYRAPDKARRFDPGGAEALAARVEALRAEIGLPARIREAGVGEREFRASLDRLVDLAFEDLSTISNPRRPLRTELRALMEAAF